MEIRDTRNGSWYWVNVAVNSCPHITYAEKCVYGALASFSGCKDIHPSFELISERSSATQRMAMKAVKRLSLVGLINVEKGGGRGNANTYILLKCPKGCIKCTVSEKGEQKNTVSKGQERVNKKTIKGEQNSTPIDKVIDKEIDNYARQSRAGQGKDKYNPLGAEIIKAFEAFNHAVKRYYANTTQREACDRLIESHGLEKVLKVIAILPKTNTMSYVPTITTPLQLEEKWSALESAMIKTKNKNAEKRGNNFIV